MNDIDELRQALFHTLRGLQDKDAPMDLERARAINETSQTLINSLRVEVDYMKITGAKGSRFIPTTMEVDTEKITACGRQTVTQIVGGRLVEHKMR